MPRPVEGGRVADNGSTTAGSAGWEARLGAVTTSLLLALGGLFSALLVSAIGFQLLLDAGIPVQDEVLIRYPAGTILTGVGFVLVVLAYLQISDRSALLQARLPTLFDLGWAVLGMAALLATLVVVSALLQQLGIQPAQHRIEAVAREDPTVLLYMLPLAFLVIGPTEELLFRGAIQGLLRRAYAPFGAIVLASVMFAIGHVFALSGTDASRLSTILVILALGTILGAVYEATDNLVVPALVHGAYDAIAFTQIYVTATGVA